MATRRVGPPIGEKHGHHFRPTPYVRAIMTLAGVVLACSLVAGVPSAAAKQQPLKIASTVPLLVQPLTNLHVRVSGYQPGKKLLVSFKGKGFSITETPVSATRSGSLVIAVPLYVRHSTQKLGSAVVSLVIHQGGRATAPRAVAIASLPPLGVYGTIPGQIAHAFLVWDALMIGQRLNQLEAEHQLTGYDTGAAIASLTTQLKATLLARNDVDRIFLNPGTTISAGPSTLGPPLTFNENSADLMDRVLAIFLLDEFKNSGAVAHAARRLAARAGRPTPSRAEDMSALLELLEQRETAGDLTNDLLTAKDPLEYVEGITKGAVAYLKPTLPEGLSDQLGVGLAIFDIGRATEDALFDVANIGVDSAYGGDPTALAADTTLMNEHLQDLKDASVNAALGPLTLGLVKAVPDNTPGSYQLMGLNLMLTDVQSLLTVAGLTSDQETAGSIVALAQNPFPSNTVGLADLQGHVAITNTQGYAAAQTSLDLCCFGAAAAGIETIADSNGDYDVLVPLGVANTPYANISLRDTDVISSQTLGSELVNLSNINTTSAWIAQPFSATCTDDDDLTPDQDDPDCDSTGPLIRESTPRPNASSTAKGSSRSR